ncbi:hypothetical protein ParaKuw1_00011 [Paracoccus phage ParKuw1]|uniref:GTA TIM-barrel-like domain-containing protein n=1 Tax=Paracoccus phage ParKuw1 TaxID=3032415 RepID=A0AAF0FHR9_9CAUD|nr:hypothetical protein ParaKuw1_00011 [Paracoccus phage ParKuw1]
MILRSRSTRTVKSLLSGVALLPSTGEWCYSTTPAAYRNEYGTTATENTQWDGGASGKTNMTRAMDNLQRNIPSNKWVSLIVSWFGDDLRLGECTVKPKGEKFNLLTPGGEGGTISIDQDLGAWNVPAVDGETEVTVYDLDQSSIFMNRISDGSTKAKLVYNWSVTGATDTSINVTFIPCSDDAGNNSISTGHLVSVSNSPDLNGALVSPEVQTPTGTQSYRIVVTRTTDGAWNDSGSDRQFDLIVSAVEPELKPDSGFSSPDPWIVNGLTRSQLGIPSIYWDSPTEYNPVYVQWMNARGGASVTTQYDTTVDPDNTVGQPYVDPDSSGFVDQGAGAVLCEYPGGGTDQEAYSSWNHADTSSGGPGGNIPYGVYRWRGYVWSPVERDFNMTVRKGGPGSDDLIAPFLTRIAAKQWVEVQLDIPCDGNFSYLEVVLDKTDDARDWFMVTNVTMFALGTAKVSYGGTPADRSILEGIADLKARGQKVLFYPFILMDITDQQRLPDPSGSGVQGAYPWRGRIRPMDADQGTAQVQTDVDNFFGSAQPDDFFPDFGNQTVQYTGAVDDWGLRRMTLHYAHLCAMAGNVDAFCIATEMIGMTTARSGPNTWPAVQALIQLAQDCREILGDSVEITYACDWSEFMPRNYNDGGFYSIFHLDPLWAHPDIDFIGIDNYLPLSDWRGSPLALDEQAWPSIYDLGYLKSQIEGGERYTYQYLNELDRDNQIRTPIAEWRYRDKDHKSWWGNLHYDIVAGTTQSSPTGWVPQSKRFAYTEYGCAAIDKGTNQPNKFLDPKSVESTVPYYSTGDRDDRAQQTYYQAMTEYWHPSAGHNPVGGNGVHFLDHDMMFAWTWDARPWPAFPRLLDVWSDGENYNAGHWLQGREWIEKT